MPRIFEEEESSCAAAALGGCVGSSSDDDWGDEGDDWGDEDEKGIDLCCEDDADFSFGSEEECAAPRNFSIYINFSISVNSKNVSN